MLTKLNFFSYFDLLFIIETEEEEKRRPDRAGEKKKIEEGKKTQSSHISDNFLSASTR